MYGRCLRSVLKCTSRKGEREREERVIGGMYLMQGSGAIERELHPPSSRDSTQTPTTHQTEGKRERTRIGAHRLFSLVLES